MPPPPKELPGFYYDPEKNRYFPLKGPIPGGELKRHRSSTSEKSDDMKLKDSKVKVTCRSEAAKLVHLRELHGRIVPVGRQRLGFKQAFQDVQVSRPMVWRYLDSYEIAGSAMEKFNVVLQTPEGQRSSSILSMGSAAGGIRFYEIAKAGGNHDSFNLPIPAWPPTSKNVMPDILPPLIFDTGIYNKLPGSISSISKIRTCNLGPSGDCLALQNALITTLGIPAIGATMYVCKLSELLDSNSPNFMDERAFKRIAALDCTIWTSACSPSGKEASVGTSKGAALVNLETSKLSWIFRSKSDIFSQQFDNSGNIVLCGLRNGSIVPVDIRQNQQRHTEHSGPSTSGRRLPVRVLGYVNYGKKHMKHQLKCNGNFTSSTILSMPSAVCSLVSLASDDRYFLGSSFDGSIKLFDMRLLQRSVQSYEGNVNTHSPLKLAVNSSETHFISGGEDSYVRIWNIKTAELLFQEKFSECIFKSVCWSEYGTYGSYKRQGSEMESWGAWLGSWEGVFYMHGTWYVMDHKRGKPLRWRAGVHRSWEGLYYMHGTDIWVL